MFSLHMEKPFALFLQFFFQGGLYKVIKDSVTGFREFVGAPDTHRWNSVLFGGISFFMH